MTSNANWKPGSYFMAHRSGPKWIAGYTSGDLRLHRTYPNSTVKGKDHWSVSHGNTGLKIAQLHGKLKDVMKTADDIQRCADWSFVDVDGWRNVTPDLPQRVLAAILTSSEVERINYTANTQEEARAGAESVRNATQPA